MSKSDERPLTEPISRRELFVELSGVALAASVVAGGAVLFRAALPNVEPGAPRRVLLGTPADFKMGTVTWLKEHELFVVRASEGIGAFSSRCTHLGCTVRRTANGFHCPCHGAHFGALGEVIDGPARRPLPWFAIETAADGRLWADLHTPVLVGGFSRELLAAAPEPT